LRYITAFKNLLALRHRQFVRYLLVGGWNTVFGMAVYAGLYRWLGEHVHYLVLLVPSNILAVTNAYVCYKLLVFKTHGNILREYFRCYIVYGGMMLIGTALLFALVEWLRVPPIVANCACIILTTIFSYLSHRNFSFAKNINTDLTRTDRIFAAPTLVFCGALIVVVLSHLISMTVIPLPWLDEVHIVEMGRSALARGSLETSFMVNSDGTGSFLAVYYLGPVLQELAFRLAGFSGVRLLPMLGLLAASIFCRLWLLKRRMSPWIATLLALVLLVDPLLTQSIRLVRVDSLAIAMCFMTLYCLRRSADHQGPPPRSDLFIVGILTGTSLFVWPTSLLFVFFYLAEFWLLRHEQQLSPRASFVLLLSAGCGAGLSILLLLIPLLPQFTTLVMNLQSYFSGQGVSATVDLNGIAYRIFICTLKDGLRSPFFMLAAFLGLLACIIRIRRNAFLVSSFLVTFFLCVRSGLHSFRFLYLFPFFFQFALLGIRQLGERSPKWSQGLLVCILIYGFSTSVFAYVGMSLIYKGRSLSAVTAQLRDVIGAGGKRVYSRTFQTYYPGRTLGWKHYRYANDLLILDDEKHAHLLAKVDYVIDSVMPTYYAIEESFTLYGLTRDYLIRAAAYVPADEDAADFAWNTGRSLQAFCSQLGRSLTFAAVSAAERQSFEQKLLALGFQQIRVIDLTVPVSAYSPLLRWPLSLQATNPDYDRLVIWKRTAAKPE
jgi:putative flippase GtrA